jgi:tetraacyldisaccharide-1-P 4'-kinase
MDYVLQRYPHAELMAFPDHHPYSPADIDRIYERARSFDFVLTTEKDMQRLQTTDLEARLLEQGKKLIALPIRMCFCSPKEAFDRHILNYVHENCRK